MFLTVLLVALLAKCHGDVSHLGTDLREDGYHYKQPSQPFLPGSSAVDNQLGIDVSQEASIRPKTNLPQPSTSKPSEPTAEYLPPDVIQPVPEPVNKYGPHSLPEPSKGYGAVAPFAPRLPQTQMPQPIHSSSPTPEQTTKEYRPPQSPRPDQRPAAVTRPRPIPEQPKKPLQTPEREYLPPSENEITSEQEQQQNYPDTQPTIPESQPTYPAPGSARRPTYSSQESTNQEPESVYVAPQPSDTKPTYPPPQPTYPAQQTINASTDESPSPQTDELDASQDFGPDGYKYKIPSKSFKY